MGVQLGESDTSDWRARVSEEARFGGRTTSGADQRPCAGGAGGHRDAGCEPEAREIESARDPLRISFKRIALLGARGARVFAAGFDLTPQRLDLLLRLHEGPLVQKQIAFQLGVTASVVSRLVTALENLGLVERRWITEDKRYRLVRLTLRGFRVILRVLDGVLPEAQGYTSQLCGELDILSRFEGELAPRSVADLSANDETVLLYAMRRSSLDDALLHFEYFDYVLPPRPSPYAFHAHVACDDTPDIDRLQHPSDREKYARHWYAGRALTDDMRKRQPRRAA